MRYCLCLLTLALVMPLTAQQDVISILEVYDLETGQRTEVMREDRHFEAPNWAPDGNFLINQSGRFYKVTSQGEKTPFDTGDAVRCNNDHGFSPDGSLLAFSNNLESGPDGWLTSCIYTVPAGGGQPTRVTDSIPSFWHGWSPGGDTLVYTALRGGQFDVYAIPATGGEELQLTDAEGLDDGPEYAPDGSYVYYNSLQSGSMEIWRMRPDGSGKEQLTDDAHSNWFAHPSPDGKQLVYISYIEDQGGAHPAMQNVALRLYDLSDGTITTLFEFIGGQGSLNVPSWSPDSKRFAFVTYAHK